MRRYVLKQLLDSACVPAQQNTICDASLCTNDLERPAWVCCDVCGRWYHLACVNVTEIPVGDFICTVCNSTYE